MQEFIARLGIVRDLFRFLWARKVYWLIPMIVALILIVVLIVAAGSGASPFVYPLF